MTAYRLRSDRLDWVEAGDEVIALDRRGSAYFSTNGAGARLWRLLVGGTSRRRLVEELTTAFEIDEERAGDDVEAFLVELDAAGLLVRVA